jgi:OmpA-OmpF porin, OOP family
MRGRLRNGLWIVFIAPLLSSTPVNAQDVEGAADHPLVSRYQGSTIIGFDAREFGAYTLALGPVSRDYTHTEPLEVEGATTRILYLAPEQRTALEVFRNYEQALTNAGFETLFTCVAKACGYLFTRIAPQGPELVEWAFSGRVREHHYLAAKATTPAGEVYLALNVAIHDSPNSWMMNRAIAQLDVIEVTKMDAEMVTVNAEVMRGDLVAKGRSMLYGIHFETDRANLTSESDATLQEIAKLLGGQPDLSLHLVGHTDDVGEFDYNMRLSRDRAAAVRDALVDRFGVEASRLVANGVGPLAPVAPNASEAGRALNRRVELVPIR